MWRRWLLVPLFLVLLAAGTGCGNAPASGGTSSQDFNGGVEVILQASCNLNGNHCSSDDLAHLPAARTILEQRIKDGLGASQAIILRDGDDHIVVDLPGQYNRKDTVALLNRTGQAEFIDTGPVGLQVGQPVPAGSTYPVVFTGADLDPSSINATLDPQSGQPVILFQFKPDKQAAFADYTGTHVGGYLTITIDNVVIESAVINSQITGQGEISGGNMTLNSAQETAALLRYGALPIPLTIVSQQQISTP